jgi:MoaA/NifB/PqqE/SkfB family radical SAM enzyme
MIPNNEYYKEAEIDISTVCNLKCPLCNRADPKLYKNLNFYSDLELFKNIIEKFPNIKKFNIGFLVSEPTLNPNLLDIINFLKSKDKTIMFSTNGNTFYEDTIFWKNLITLFDLTDEIVWSMDGLNQETYKQYRIGGNIDKVIKNIIRAEKLFPNLKQRIQFIKFKHNEKDLEFLEQFKLENGIKSNFDIIESNGKCSIINEDSNVSPTWDYDKWLRIKKTVLKSKTIDCECLPEQILFIDAYGKIGFCLPQLTDSIKNGNPITVYDKIEDINNYIRSSYLNRFHNNICQFYCGNIMKEIKLKQNISSSYA